MRLLLSTVITILITAPFHASAAAPAAPENNVVVYGKVLYENGTPAEGCIYVIQVYNRSSLISERTGLAGTGYVEPNMIYESGNIVNGAGDMFTVTLTSPDGSQTGKWEHVLTGEEKRKNIVQMPDLVLRTSDEGMISRWGAWMWSYVSQFKRVLAGLAITGGGK